MSEPRRRQRRKTLTDTMIAALPRRAGKTYFFADPERCPSTASASGRSGRAPTR
jgi:hypothetical protein